MCKLQAAEIHMHHKHATSQIFFPPIYDVVLANYDVSPSCRFSHATAQMNLNLLLGVSMFPILQYIVDYQCIEIINLRLQKLEVHIIDLKSWKILFFSQSNFYLMSITLFLCIVERVIEHLLYVCILWLNIVTVAYWAWESVSKRLEGVQGLYWHRDVTHSGTARFSYTYQGLPVPRLRMERF